MPDKILVTTSTFGESDSSPILLLEQAGYKVVLNPYKRKLTKEESKKLLPGHVGLIAGLQTLDDEVLSVSGLKVISRCGSGMSNVDLEAAKRRKIEVCSTPEAPVNAVAELTLGCLLSLLRRISQLDQLMHQGTWKKHTGRELTGKTIVIIGFGRIGRRLSALLSPFAVKQIIVDPLVKDIPAGIRQMALKDALALADIISLHCSGDKCVLGREELSLIKKGVLILNAARGGLIDETALQEALERGQVDGAWLDTFRTEPYTGPLLKNDRVLLTPHIGSYTGECRSEMEMQAAKNLLTALKKG
ncbi:MAG: NAD(P)-dependent oxidoreductase [Candidatus Omnitrophota bacterium]